MEERRQAYKSMRKVQGRRVQAINTEYPSWMSSVVFQSKNQPWDKSQVEIILGRTLLGDEADSSGLGGYQTNLLSRRRRLVSLDVLKLNCGEDVIRQIQIHGYWWLSPHIQHDLNVYYVQEKMCMPAIFTQVFIIDAWIWEGSMNISGVRRGKIGVHNTNTL